MLINSEGVLWKIAVYNIIMNYVHPNIVSGKYKQEDINPRELAKLIMGFYFGMEYTRKHFML
jgi:hypothetical protein